MASKAPKKIIDIQNKLRVYSIRISKFFKHKLLAKRKTALVIGGDSLPVFKSSILDKLMKTWALTQLNVCNVSQLEFDDSKA